MPWPTNTERLVPSTSTSAWTNPDHVSGTWTMIWTRPYKIPVSSSIERELGQTISFILFSNTDIRMMSLTEYERECQIWKGWKSDNPIFNNILKRPSKPQSKTKLSWKEDWGKSVIFPPFKTRDTGCSQKTIPYSDGSRTWINICPDVQARHHPMEN